MLPQRILLIQSDATAAKTIVDALSHCKDQSFQIDWVERCSDGLQNLDGTEAILLDLDLSDAHGIDTFNCLLRAAPNIPILLLMDPQHEETARLAVQSGAQGYLFKDRLDPYLLSKTLATMIERAAYAEALFEERERAQVTLNSIGDAVVSTDVSGRVTYLNVVAQELTAWSQHEATGHPLEEVLQILDATTRQPLQNFAMLAIRDDKTLALPPNSVLIRRDGSESAIEDSIAPIHDRRGTVTGAVIVLHDVSAARAITRHMTHLAQHDSLTGLPNRVLLNDRLREAIMLSSRHKRRLSVLFLDLDRFKHINDSKGHVVGDRLLQSVARRLSTCVRSSDTVGRLGGDEFVVLLWEVRRAEDPAVTAATILDAVRKPHLIDEDELHITGSIGIVAYPDDGADVETLMKKADLAMYQAKDNGRDGYHFFDPEMNARAIEQRSLEDSLRYAIERQELVLHYQPKFSLVTGGIVGTEALIRWHHPQRGLVPPGKFITIAEDCGLIVPIGRWVLREACREACAWQSAGLSPLGVAINVSAVELRTRGFVSGVRSILKETGLDPQYLELELTETVLIEDSRSVAEVLRELKDIGVLLTLDDFGTGYSSLSHLKRFPIDALKIDQSFVRDLAVDENDASIVIAMIWMGKSLHVRVVAEGVETREQLEILQENGCPQGQGNYFNPPMPAEEFRDLLERQTAPMAVARSTRRNGRGAARRLHSLMGS